MEPESAAGAPDPRPLLALALPDGADDRVLGELLAHRPGAVLLPAAGADSLRATAARIHARAPEVLVAVGEHAAGEEWLPSAAALGAVDDVDATRRLGDALGDVLAACGVDLLLGPRLDVASGPDPLVGTSAVGADPDLVTRHARALAGGVRDAGVAVCALDALATGALQHGGPAVVGTDREALAASHLIPWELAAWLDAVRTAPVEVPALGPGPASLAAWAPELLDALGHARFHGLVLAGDLPGAATRAGVGIGEAAVRALEAGAHLLEVGDAARAPEVHRALAAAATGGRSDPALLAGRIAETAARIRSLRARRQWLPTPDPDRARAALAERGEALAVRAVESRRALLAPGPVQVLDLRTEAGPAARTALATALAALGHPAPGSGDPGIGDPAPQLLALTARPGTDPAERARLAELRAARPDVVVVHVGRAEAAPDVPRRVLTHGPHPVLLRAAAAALAGEAGEIRSTRPGGVL